jgi:hypothetical protein
MPTGDSSGATWDEGMGYVTTTSTTGEYTWTVASIPFALGNQVYVPSIQQIQNKENVEMKGLWNVYLVYGGDRDLPIQHVSLLILASDAEDAKVKSGLYSKVEKDWDSDYLTICAVKVCDVKIKAKPAEVKNV